MISSVNTVNHDNTVTCEVFGTKSQICSQRFEDFFRKNRRFFHELLKIFSIRIGDFLYLCSLKTSEL